MMMICYSTFQKLHLNQWAAQKLCVKVKSCDQVTVADLVGHFSQRIQLAGYSVATTGLTVEQKQHLTAHVPSIGGAVWLLTAAAVTGFLAVKSPGHVIYLKKN